ncbi:hypothetical protein PV379_03545 [Streptomyces caniscabiei]|uniref:hypothetical protein n=1 Tax=Streptomyces caniscabiei TaxID=2746961 RepID=UPI0029A78F25|nr:hypothetical protein [Streptomyces caniscabiei]MDX2776414.1 hypothetical protein [Streptomyces caniscabiei]
MKIKIIQKIKHTLILSSLAGFFITICSIQSSPVHAGVNGWDAGNIITDSVFANKNTMNAGGIQSFLNSKVSHCDTWGEQPSEFGGGTRRQWAEARGYSPPYTCLKDYSQNGKSASQIIYDTAQEFSINPQVLIVLLQKEQSLITDTWPLSLQYRSATGYGCPDTAPCDAEYYGFTNQVRWAARMFRAILNNSPTWYTPYVLGNNFINYSPDSACGGSNVYIQNRATQALYNYTPYQPNQAALDAGWGTAHCGAYGNRNFYLYFTSWFGSTRGAPYVSLDTPRWMRISNTVQKKNPWTNETIGESLVAGTQLRFVDKVFVDGVWYLRTEYDRNQKLDRGVPLTSITDIEFEPLQDPRYMELSIWAYKVNPRSHVSNTSFAFSAGTSVKFTSKIYVNGQWYYRTEFDEINGNITAFGANKVRELTYRSLDTPRYMKTKKDTQRVNPALGTTDSTTIPEGTEIKFTTKTLAGATWHYRSEEDTNANQNLAIPSSDVVDIPYTAFDSHPKWFKLKSGAKKVHPSSGTIIQPSSMFTGNERMRITQKITVNDQTFYRTEFDALNQFDRAIPQSDVEEIPYIPLDNPRTMRISTPTSKLNPKTGEVSGSNFAPGTLLNFTTKINIDGKWYYRTASDTTNNIDLAIPSWHVEEVQ